jgi:DNA polymerase III delta prime subunit
MYIQFRRAAIWHAVVLQGPPGTGKTTSILALAHTLLGPNYRDAVLEVNRAGGRQSKPFGLHYCSCWGDWNHPGVALPGSTLSSASQALLYAEARRGCSFLGHVFKRCFLEQAPDRQTLCSSARAAQRERRSRHRRRPQQDQDVRTEESDTAAGAPQDRHPRRGGQVRLASSFGTVRILLMAA